MDLMQEYYTWQNPERANQFSYCQYPFILSIVAKQHILTKDSEQQASLHATLYWGQVIYWVKGSVSVLF